MLSVIKKFNCIWAVLLLVNQIDVLVNAAPSNPNYNSQNGYSDKLQMSPNQRQHYQFNIPVAQSVPTNPPGIQCNLKCQLNEICQLKIDESNQFECVCPQTLNYFRIKNVCRELLPNTGNCQITWNSCQQDNEDCVPVDEYSQEGSCQCQVGYTRSDPSSYECIRQMIAIDNLQSDDSLYEKLLDRRRPDIKEVPSKDIDLEDNFVQQIIEEISKEDYAATKKLADSKEIQHQFDKTQKVLDLLQTSEITNLDSSRNTKKIEISTTTSTTTPTSTTTTTTTTTEVQQITTENLIADAGVDIHVYYPSRVCVLNGTSTKFKSVNEKEFVSKWTWTKLDSSPAFGKFTNQNEGDVVVYENLVEGVYRFRLQVWTNTNEFSQDTVYVYVHSSSMASQPNTHNNSRSNSTDLELIYKNLIQIELDYKPQAFSQSIRSNFLTRLEILLKQSEFNYNNLKVILINTRVSVGSKESSHVILEFFVCEDLGLELNSGGDLLKNVFDFRKYSSLEEHASLALDTPLPNIPQVIVDSKDIVRLLKHKSLGKLIDSTLAYINKLPVNELKKTDLLEKSGHYSELNIMDVSLLTCVVGNLSGGGQCSEHGECDRFSGKCMCDKFWMPNLYLFYLRNDRDLTSGNNCEWNIPLAVSLSLLILIVTWVALKMLFRHVFYYLFCCCLCRRRDSKANFRHKIDKSYRKEKYSLFNRGKKNSHESDEDETDADECEEDADKLLNSSSYSDENMQFQKVAFKKFLKNFRSAPAKNYKYAVLADQEDMQLTDCKKNRKSVGRMGAELTENDEEDVVYDKKTSPKIKEYKNII